MIAPFYISRPVHYGHNLVNWAVLNGFKDIVPEESLHVTQAYSKAAVDWDTIPIESQSVYVYYPQFEVRAFDNGSVALTFPCEYLEARHKKLLALGASWDYPDYHPHISISYGGFIPASIKPFKYLLLGPEKLEALNTEWKA